MQKFYCQTFPRHFLVGIDLQARIFGQLPGNYRSCPCSAHRHQRKLPNTHGRIGNSACLLSELLKGTWISTCIYAGESQDVCLPDVIRKKHNHLIGRSGKD